MEATTQAAECRSLVEGLYKFKDNYFVSRSAENPLTFRREDDVKIKLKETLERLDESAKQLPPKDRNYLYSFLRGKALNILPEFSKEAYDLLGKAVKLNPLQTEAWNQLGECYWKQSNVEAALTCFESAVKHCSKDAESLRNLSVVLRQVGRTPDQRAANLMRSLDIALEAVRADVQNGLNWAILGNSYMTVFCRSPRIDNTQLEKCKSAYTRASMDKVASTQPDFLYNYSNLLIYEEKYQEALQSLTLAAQMDPSWTELKDWKELLLKFLVDTSDMVAKRASLKLKRIHNLVTDLNTKLGGLALSDRGDGYKQRFIKDLSQGPNAKMVIALKVIGCVAYEKEVFKTVCAIDSNQDCIALSLFNIGKEPKIGDTFVVANPTYQRIQIVCDNREVAFSNIRIEDPTSVLLNGKPYPREFLVRPKADNIIRH